MSKYCVNCGTQMSDEQLFCDNCGTKFGESGPKVEAVTTPGTTQYSMKWFKCLIWFMLFFSALYDFIYGINYITGGIYMVQTNGEATAELVYMFYGSALKTLDVIYGFSLLAMAVLCIVTRFKLAKYKADGPQFVYIVYAASAVTALIYSVGVAIIANNSTMIASTITGVVVQAAILFANYKYFTKRKELFVN